MRSLFRTLSGYRGRVLGDHFKTLYVITQQEKFHRRLQREKEQTRKALEDEVGRKEREIANNTKKIEEQNNLINGLKNRDSELLNKAKQLDKHISSLEGLIKGGKPDIARPESSKESRNLIQKVAPLIHSFRLTL